MKTNLQLKITIKRIVPVRNIAYYLFLFIVLFPPVLSYLTFFRYFRYIQIALSFICIGIFLMFLPRNKYTRWTLVFFLVFLLSTIINNSDYSNVSYYFTRCFAAVVIPLIFSKKDDHSFWECSSKYFALLAILNAILTLVFPDGLLTTSSINSYVKGIHLFGEANQIMPFYIVAITLCMMFYLIRGDGRLRLILVILAAWASELNYRSSTAMIGLALITVLYCWFYIVAPRRRQRKFFNTYFWIFIGVIAVGFLYYSIVVLRIQDNFSFVFEQLFGKSSDFSTRANIWDVALQMIKESFIWGYGGTADKYIQIYNYRFNSHNLVLQIFLMGGLVLILSFVRLVSISLSYLVKLEDKNMRNCLLIMMVVLAVMSLTEVYTLSLLFFALLLPEVTYTHKAMDIIDT